MTDAYAQTLELCLWWGMPRERAEAVARKYAGIDAEMRELLTPEAYEHVQERELEFPFGSDGAEEER